MRNVNYICIFLFGFLFVNGCGLNSLFLDESNLEKVANYYFQPGKENPLSPEDQYRFLSAKSKENVSLDEWKNLPAGVGLTASVSVLGEKSQLGNIYSVVSVTAVSPDKTKKLTEIVTWTWIRENGKWRKLSFPKIREECIKAFESGDYSTAKAKAEEWLSMDPYSIKAYDLLGFAIARSDSSSSPDTDQSLNEIVRAMLAINPDDSQALDFASLFSETPSIAKSYLQKLEGTTFYEKTAFNYATTKIDDSDERLKFINGIEATPLLSILKLEALENLINNGSKNYTWNDFKQVSTTEGTFEKIKEALDESDSSFAALWAGELGKIFLKAKDDDTARKWLDYGISRDPNNESVKALADVLDSQQK